MNTYLLTWNPKRWDWNLDDDVSSLKLHGYFDGRWSSGSTKRIEIGDRIYLMRLGVEPRGVMASGYALSSVFQHEHWDSNRDDLANYVDVRFDTILVPDVDGVLPLFVLQNGPTSKTHWTPQASGTSIDPVSAMHLDMIWHSFLEKKGQSPVHLPEEISTPALFFEGASRQISINSYERNPRARKACIDHYGCACFVCGFDFGERYGDIGKGFIHVHHLVPISDIDKGYSVNPIEDLRPVCPNCHAMLHKSSSTLSIEELQTRIR